MKRLALATTLFVLCTLPATTANDLFIHNKSKNKAKSELNDALRSPVSGGGGGKQSQQISHSSSHTQHNPYREKSMVILALCVVLIAQIIIRSRVFGKANENKIRQRCMQSYLDGVETARERLSKELHDSISNGLLALKMRALQLESAEEIIEQLEKMHAEVRAISHDLMPPVFEHAQFSEVLFDYVYLWNELDQTHISLTFDPEDNSWDKLPEKTCMGLYRMIQEAVGNAFKHAGATEVNISLTRKAGTVSLRVEDNGKGFDTESTHKGIGLKLIKQRAANLHGQVDIQASPGKGTKIKITVKCHIKRAGTNPGS